MADIPGVSLNLTGASGTQGALSPMSNWRFYVLPRGGYASQISSGTTITFDSAAVAARFAVGQWIQAGIQTANLRQVSGVGGNSITVSGAALSVAVNDRIFVIGATQPTVTGGSATYTTPDTRIYQRDDDTSTLYTNSMVTSNSDGLVQFFAPSNTLDAIIQDSNQGNQGFIADLTIGAAGISTSSVTTFGATVTINAALGVTGTLVVGATATFDANVGTTGYVLVGTTLTVNGNFGVTGYALIGATFTANRNAGITGYLLVGSTLTVNGNAGFTGYVLATAGLSVSGGIFGVSAQPRVSLYSTAGNSIGTGAAGVTTTLTWDTEAFNVGGLHAAGSTASRISIPSGSGGVYLVGTMLQLSQDNSQQTLDATVRKNGATTIIHTHIDPGAGSTLPYDTNLSIIDLAAASDYYEVLIRTISGNTWNLAGGSQHSKFWAIKLF